MGKGGKMMDYELVMQELESLGKERMKKLTLVMVHTSLFLG